MRRPAAAVSIAVIAVVLAACAEPGTDVVDLSVVTVLPKEVGPGGFLQTVEEDGVASGYFYKDDISDCGEAVLDAAGSWAAQRQLMETEREVGEGAARVRLVQDQASGSGFLIRYSLASGNTQARVRVTHEAAEGDTAPTSQELVSLGLPELAEATVAAAQCGGSG
jgi:hypothetical protein